MKKYEAPNFEIHEFDELDVITTSSILGGEADENVGGDGGMLD